MKIVVALGGNALLQRGQALSAKNQRDNIQQVAKQLALLHTDHQLVITHGNGPQVGLLASMDAAFTSVDPYPLDVISAGTMGMIGYMIAHALSNEVAETVDIVTVLTRVMVAANDPAFKHLTKPVGPFYDQIEMENIKAQTNWSFTNITDKFRRVVASPLPQRIVELETIKLLIDANRLVICVGGGGIPVVYDNNTIVGVEAVVDKDLSSCLLARGLQAQMLVMLTDVDGIFVDYGSSNQRCIKAVNPAVLIKMEFPAGSMGPKVLGACQFVSETGYPSVIGQLSDVVDMVNGRAGTWISNHVEGIEYWS